MKSLRDGRFTDDTFEFMQIRLAQVNESIKNLLAIDTTQPTIEVVEPVNVKGLDSAITELLTSLKQK
jgi:hypothetical protein